MSSIVQTDSDERPADWPVEPGRMHFRLIDQFLGPMELGCNSGYVVRSYDFAMPEVRAVTYNNSLDDGVFDVTKYLGPRAVSLELTLKARASVNDVGPLLMSEARLRDRVRAYLHPARRPRLVFTEHEDDRCRQIMLRGAESAAAFAQARYNAMSASWVAPRSYIESYAVHTVTATLDEQMPEELGLDIVNAGNAPAYWAVRIQGEMIKPQIRLYNPVWGTHYLQLDYTVPHPSDVVQIDSFSKSVLINGQPIGFRYVSDKSQWFRIPPGTSHLTFDSEDSVRKGWEYGTWTDRASVGGQAALGAWSDRAAVLPMPTPPDDPQGPPFAWSSQIYLPPMPDGTQITLKGYIPTGPPTISGSTKGDGYIALDTFNLWVWDTLGTDAWVDYGHVAPAPTQIKFVWTDTWL